MNKELKNIVKEFEKWSGHTIGETDKDLIVERMKSITYSMACEIEQTGSQFYNQVENIT